MSLSTSEEQKAEFSARLRAERERLQLSQAQLAEAWGGSVRSIGNAERGISWPGCDLLVTLANLGGNVQFIAGGADGAAEATEPDPANSDLSPDQDPCQAEQALGVALDVQAHLHEQQNDTFSAEQLKALVGLIYHLNLNQADTLQVLQSMQRFFTD